MNHIKLQNKTDTTFTNSKNKKTFLSPQAITQLSDKIDLKRSDRSVASSNLNIYYT